MKHSIALALTLAGLLALSVQAQELPASALGSQSRVLDITDAVPQRISVQGYLTDTLGIAVHDTLSMTFRLYADSIGGGVLWSGVYPVAVDSGLFTAKLAIPAQQFLDGQRRWLDVSVGGEPAFARVEATSTVYAYRSIKSDSAVHSDTAEFARHGALARPVTPPIGTSEIDDEAITTQKLMDDHVTVDKLAHDINATAIGFDADKVDGHDASDFLSTSSDFGRAGVATALYEGNTPLASKYLHRDSSVSNADRVDGFHASATPASNSLFALDNNACFSMTRTGLASGVWPVYVDAQGTGASGEYVIAVAAKALSTSSTGGAYGISAEGYASGGYGCGWGVSAVADSGNEATGVDGVALGNAALTNIGVSGRAIDRNLGASHYGIYGNAGGPGNNDCVGVYGIGNTAGVKGRTDFSGGYGVWGRSIGGAYGVYYQGGMGGSGWDHLNVASSRGPVALAAVHSPEDWVEDFGNGRLGNGRAHIELDPRLLEVVSVQDGGDYKVFVQLSDDCAGVYVVKYVTGFDVVELGNGRSDAAFDYRIVAKRRGYETLRLPVVHSSADDAELRLTERDFLARQAKVKGE